MPTITTWQAIPSGSTSTGSGRSMLDGNYTYIVSLGQNNGVLSTTQSSAWCNFTLDGESGSHLLRMVYHRRNQTADIYKKVRYFYLYAVNSGVLTLIQRIDTLSPAVLDAATENLNLNVPYEFSGVQEFRILASTSWGNAYIWVTEITFFGCRL